MGSSFQTISLKISFYIPPFHRSITTPHGDIYLLGGSDQKKLAEIYSYEPINRTLLPAGSLLTARSSFAVCYLHPYIYSACGFAQLSALTTSCERYHVISAKSDRIADCLYAANAPTLMPFKNDYIYKFGANNEDGSNLNLVERFLLTENRWENVAFKTEPDFLGFFQFGSGCQINENQMIVFGGYDFQNLCFDSNYLVENHGT